MTFSGPPNNPGLASAGSRGGHPFSGPTHDPGLITPGCTPGPPTPDPTTGAPVWSCPMPAPPAPTVFPPNNILFTTFGVGAVGEVFTINVDGSSLTQISNGTEAPTTARWTRDGSKIIGSNFGIPSPGSFWTLPTLHAFPPANGPIIEIGSTGQPPPQIPGYGGAPCDSSPDGNSLVSSVNTGFLVITTPYFFPPTRPGFSAVVAKSLNGPAGSGRSAVFWIPDNSGVSYTGPNTITSNDEAHTCGFDGTDDNTILTDSTGFWWWDVQDWHYDSSALLVVWVNQHTNAAQLWRVARDGSRGTLLYDDPSGAVLGVGFGQAALSPDETHIVISGNNDQRVLVMAAAGGVPIPIFAPTSAPFPLVVDW